MKRLSVLVASLATLGLAFAGCSAEPAATGTAGGAGEKIKVGIAIPAGNETFWTSWIKGAQAEGAKLGVEVVIADAKNDAQTMNDQVNTMIVSGIKGLAVASVDPTANKPAAQAATDAGIKMITSNRTLDMAYGGVGGANPIVHTGFNDLQMGGFQGDFASLAASDLGAVAIRAAVERAGLVPGAVDKAIMGCVLPAGQGQAPARQAALKAGLPQSVPCTTVNKMCGSAMEAAILAHDMLASGSHDVIVAGGMESMTNAPYLLPKARAGYRMGHQTVCDHMFLDGLEDAYDKGRLMGTYAEDCATTYPGVFVSTTNAEMPLLPAARSVTANTIATSACLPVVMNCLTPFST